MRNLSVLLILIALVGIGTAILTYTQVNRMIRNSLLERAATIAAAIDIQEIEPLTGTGTDLENPVYQDLKTKLAGLVEANSDAQFVYVNGKRNGEIFFFADSEPTGSPDESPPGQVYYEASEAFHNTFDQNISAVEGPVSDRWGSWISAMSPISHPETGAVVAVVGLDVSADHYYRTLIIYVSVPLLITLLLFVVTFFIYRIQKKERALVQLKSELARIAAHDLRTPLVGINWSLDSMLGKDAKETFSQEHTQDLRSIRESSAKLLETANKILETSTEKKK